MATGLASAISDRRQARSLTGTGSPDEKAIISMLSRIEKGDLDLDKFLEKPQKPPLLERAIDFISRPNYASAAASQKLLQGGNLFEAADEFVAGIRGERKKDFGKVLKEEGVGEMGSTNVPLLGKVTGRGAAGFALDVLLDPTTYLSLGTGTAVKTIGKAGAKKALTEAGELALKEGTEKAAKGMSEKILAQRLARKAAGRANAVTLQNAARDLIESGATDFSPGVLSKARQATEENLLRKGDKELFEQGGINFVVPFTKIRKNLIPGERIAEVAREISGGARRVPVAGSVFGNVIDYTKNAVDVVRDVTGSIFTPGHEFTKQLKELTAEKKKIAAMMGLTEKEAIKVFPEISREVSETLKYVAKNKRFAAQQGYKTMVDMFGAINPEEGKAIAMALEGIKSAEDSLSSMGKQALESTRTLLKTIGTEQMDYGFINRMVTNFTPRFLSEDAKNFLKENVESVDPARRALVKIFAPAKNAERVLIKDQHYQEMLKQAPTETARKKLKDKFTRTFFGEEVKENTLEEINDIASRKLGFKWFEDDITRALPRYYTKFLGNKAVFDGIADLPRSLNEGSGYEIFKPFKDTVMKSKREIEKLPMEKMLGIAAPTEEITQKISGTVLPGYKKFTIPQLENWQAPRFMVDQIEKTYDVLASEKQLNKFIKAYDSALSKFKLGVTAPWPTFHTQNFIGGQFSNYMYGITPGSPTWMNRMKQTINMVADKNLDEKVGEGAVKNLTFGQIKELYERHGASGGFFHGDVGDSVYRKVFNRTDPLGRMRAGPDATMGEQLKQGAEAVTDKAADFLSKVGGTVEDTNRLPIFLEEMIKHGDPKRAVKEVFKYHFDYAPEAYSSIEREVFQRLIPFYRFMRGNIPLQLNALHSQTGRMTSVMKAIRDLSADSEKDKPEWMRRTFSIPLDGPGAALFKKKKGDKVFATLPVPLAEIGRIEPAQLLSSITPFLKVPIELITNREMFFGNQIYNPNLPEAARTKKAYSILKPLTLLPGVEEFINWREKPIKDPLTGKFTGEIYYEADAQKMYLLRNILGPVSRAYMLFGQMPDETLAGGLADVLLPTNILSVNPAEQQVYDLKQSRQELTELTGWLRARNLIPEAKDDDKTKRVRTQDAVKYLQNLRQ